MSKSIASKLIGIMKDCGYVQKDARNDFHKYKYVSAANILEKVNDSLVKHGLATLVKTEILSSVTEANDKGKMEKFSTVRVNVTLVDSDTGDTMEISAVGSGQDNGDKAVAKAQTMALKYAWMMTLNISTGDDPESDASVDERTYQPKRPPDAFMNHIEKHTPGTKASMQTGEYWAKTYDDVKNWDEYNAAKAALGDSFKMMSSQEKSLIIQSANKAKERISNAA